MRRGKLDVSCGFIILISVLYYFDTQNLLPWLILAALLHESGHYISIRAAGGRISGLRLTAVGAVMELENSGSLSYGKEIAASLAGPAAGICSAVLASALGKLLDCGSLYAFSGISLALSLFNLLPLRQLDGGKALCLFISYLIGPQEAEAVCVRITYVFGAALCLAGAYIYYRTGRNFTLLTAAVWLLLTADRENGIVNRRAAV